MADPAKARRSGVELAQMCGHRLESLRTARVTWEGIWQELATYIMPRKADWLLHGSVTPGTTASDVLFDTTAVYANQTLANGQLSYMTPSDSRWFTLDPPEPLKKKDEVSTWFQKCSEIMQAELANSNFYSEIHEMYFDDGGFGTSCIVVLPGKRSALNFQTQTIGSYWIDEDDEGLIDTCFREMNLTARQAEQKFGEEKLSPKMKISLEKFRKDGKGGDRFCIIHAIFPRTDDQREYGKSDGQNKPWASVYFVPSEKHTISNEGFDEKPFFASRHLRWGDSVYGYGPGLMALPEARQLNFLGKQLDALAEVAAFPRMLLPDTMVDEIDLRAGGGTYYDATNPQALPKEWMTGGKYDIGLDREKRKQAAIERAYHVDLFQMFANLEKQMTAREVAERSAEKLIQFTPAFARKTTEVLNPLLQRVFGILMRAGKFPQPPQEVLIQTPEGLAVPDPEIAYNSRVALAIKALQNTAFYRTMELILPLSQTQPDILDNFDLDTISRETSRNDGLPADWMRKTEDRDKIRAARAEAIAAEQEQQAALAASQAAKNVGSIKPDSVAGQALAAQGA